MDDRTKITIERIKAAREKQKMSYQDISDITGFSKSVLQRYETGAVKKIPIDRLEKIALALSVPPEWLMGYDTTMRDIPLSDNIIPLPKTKKVPLLGAIACGEPILAVENIDKYVEMPETVGGTFALKCKGDSMINARIFDGDVVYIRQQSDVDNGDIAAVLIGEEATLKRVYKYPSKVVLRPENPMYEDMTYNNEELDQIRILGKAVAFLSAVR